MNTFRIAMFVMLFASKSMAENTLNIYAWGGIIPHEVITQFERETGVTVNLSTYDSNETLYAKLKANKHNRYDIILPSSYLVSRLQRHHKLLVLDKQHLSNIKNINPYFMHQPYDPTNKYSIPLIWGTTGIIIQKNRIQPTPQTWAALWNPKFKNKLLLLDDTREIFSIALLRLGYPANDSDSVHIHQAFESLRNLLPNIKLFASEGIQALIIDEEVSVAVAWNGDAIKAEQENENITFVYPKEGFVIWVDCLAIPKDAPHPDLAYQFINFMLRPDIARTLAMLQGHALTNQEGIKLLPSEIKNNPMIYPNKETLQRGYFQSDLDESTLQLYNQYWEKLKLSF